MTITVKKLKKEMATIVKNAQNRDIKMQDIRFNLESLQ